MTKLRGVNPVDVAEAFFRLLRSKLSGTHHRLRCLSDSPSGRATLTDAERLMALRIDSGLRRLGVRCLSRAVVVTEMLRRRGLAAMIRISVSVRDAKDAHADVEVGGLTLRSMSPGRVVLR